MKAAIISSVNLLRRYSSMSTLQMCLAQLWNNIAYREYFLERKAMGDTVILDNGAYELKKSVDLSYLLKVAEELQPQILVLPDELMNGQSTVRLVREFIQTHLNDGLKARLPTTEYMVVPQGASPEEWRKCLSGLITLDYPFTYWGVPKVSHLVFGGTRLTQCKEIVEAIPEAKIHLLGIWSDPIGEVLEARKISQVVSIDSKIPVTLGLAGRSLSEHHPKPISANYVYEWDAFPTWTVKQVHRFLEICEGKLTPKQRTVHY